MSTPRERTYTIECPARDALYKLHASFNEATIPAYVTDYMGRKYTVPYMELDDTSEKLNPAGL